MEHSLVLFICFVIVICLLVVLFYEIRNGRLKLLTTAVHADASRIEADVILEIRKLEADGKIAVGTVAKYIESHIALAAAKAGAIEAAIFRKEKP